MPPVNLTILFQLSDIYFAGGNYIETVQVLKKIIGTGVKNPEKLIAARILLEIRDSNQKRYLFVSR